MAQSVQSKLIYGLVRAARTDAVCDSLEQNTFSRSSVDFIGFLASFLFHRKCNFHYVAVICCCWLVDGCQVALYGAKLVLVVPEIRYKQVSIVIGRFIEMLPQFSVRQMNAGKRRVRARSRSR